MSMNPKLDWVTTKRVSQELGLSRQQVGKLGRSGVLATRKLPGLRIQYSLQDAQRLAREETRSNGVSNSI
jgi:hypothetical protein